VSGKGRQDIVNAVLNISSTRLDPVGVSEAERGIKSVSHLGILLVEERVEIEIMQDILAVERSVL
jgi:hypothetical protein